MANSRHAASLGPGVPADYQAKARATEGRFRVQDYGAFLKPPELVRRREQSIPSARNLPAERCAVHFSSFPGGASSAGHPTVAQVRASSWTIDQPPPVLRARCAPIAFSSR